MCDQVIRCTSLCAALSFMLCSDTLLPTHVTQLPIHVFLLQCRLKRWEEEEERQMQMAIMATGAADQAARQQQPLGYVGYH